MGISAGEVESVLRFTVSQSDVAAANEAVAGLRAQFDALGGSATAAGQQIGIAMGVATAQVASLQAQMTANSAANTAATAAATNANTAGATAAQGHAAALGPVKDGYVDIEMIATRMAIRLGILFAVRGIAEFVINLYETSAALVDLSDKTGLSLGELKHLEGQAAASGVSVGQLSNAINTFDRNLATTSVASGNALLDIGSSFESLFQKQPDKRFNEVVDSIAAMPSQLQRFKAEIALFGTDAIDPLITAFAKLPEAQKRALSQMNEDATRELADADKAYQRIWSTIKDGGAVAVVTIENMARSLGTPFANAAASATPVLTFFKDLELRAIAASIGMKEITEGNIKQGLRDIFKDISSINEGLVKINAPRPTDSPVIGAARIAQLEKEAEDTGHLTDKQIESLEVLTKLGKLNAEEAIKQNVSEDQLKWWNATVEAAKRADTAIEAAYRHEVQFIEATTKQGLAGYGDEEKVRLIVAEGEAIAKVTQIAMDGANSRKEQLRLEAEGIKTINGLIQQEVDLSLKIAKVNNDAVLAENAARSANNEASGLRSDGTISDKDLNAADAAERRYEEGLHRLEVLKRAGINTTQQEIQLQRQFYEEMAKYTAQAADELNKVAAAGYNAFNAGALPNGQVTTPIKFGPSQFGSFPLGTGKAGGGTVFGGTSYPIGENGPEIFTPSSSGTITPNGGSGSLTVQVNVSGILMSSDPQARVALAKLISDAVSKVTRENRKVGSA